MPKLDLFTQKRLIKFIDEHRQQSGQLPTLQDFEKAGIRDKVIEMFYVNLTNGTIVKGYRKHS